MPEKNKVLAKTALMLTLIAGGSKVFGFIREMVIAYVYGAGAVTDAFTIAMGVVTTAYVLVSVYLTTTFVPSYTKVREHQGETASLQYTNTNLWLTLFVNVVLMFLLFTVAPFVSKWVAPGFSDTQTLIVNSALRISLIQLPFLAAVALFSGYLSARESFYGPNLIGVPLSIVVSTICLILGIRSGVHGLALGYLFGTVSQLLILFLWLPRERYKVKFDFKITQEVRESVVLLLPALLGSAVNELSLWVNRILASGLPEGSIASINFAARLNSMVPGLLIYPLAGIVFTLISEHAAKKENSEMLETFWRWVRMVLFFVIPIVAIAIPTSTDIVRIVYQRGEFDASATQSTSTAFIWYLPSLLSTVIQVFVVRFYYAIRDTKTPMVCSALAVAVNIIASVILVRVMGIAGLALSTSIGSVFAAFFMLLFLRRKLGPIGLSYTAKSVLKMMTCAVACLLCVFGIMQLLSGQNVILRFAVCTVVGGSVYLALTIAIKEAVAIEALNYIKQGIIGKRR